MTDVVDNLAGATDEAPPSEATVHVPGLPRAAPTPEGMAPMIRNAWYVIAERSACDRSLSSVKALGQPLVFFRTEAGAPIVLDDRCAHRRYALSKGVLSGDTVRCGYHGYEYDVSGRCVLEPVSGEAQPVAVRSYPVVEHGPWIWVWMGDPELADQTPLPLEDGTMDPERSFTVYTHNPGNYLMLIENLLDLTHIPFLHGAAAADEDQARVPLTRISVPGGVGWEKSVESERQRMLAMWTGGDPEQVVSSWTNARQIGPSFNDSTTKRTEQPGAERPASPADFYVAHAITPEDARNTHQFTLFRVNDPLVLPAEVLANIVSEQVFASDVDAIRTMQEMIEIEDRTGRVEYNTQNDRFGMAMRRKLRDMKLAEESERID